MTSVVRLLVCGGMFVAGYLLGRQSYRLELQKDQYDAIDDPDWAPPESDAVRPGDRDAEG
ncbi:MAG: hypothetical protein WBN68_09840 [Sedimenticolaceae bacterium]